MRPVCTIFADDDSLRRHIPYRGRRGFRTGSPGAVPAAGRGVRPLPRVPRAHRCGPRPGAARRGDSLPADRAFQDARDLLRRRGARSRLHVERHDGHDLLAPPDAVAGALRGDVPPRIPHLLRRPGPVEPLRPAAQLPAPQRLVADLHGRPPDRRLRLGRLLPRRLRRAVGGDARGPEAEDPAGSELCALGPRGALRPEAGEHGRNGDGRHEGLPRRDSQRGVPPDPLPGIRRRGDPLGIRHGGTDLAGLLRRRQPLPLPGLDARGGARRQ